MNLAGAIESAENQYKQILEEFFISVYNEKSLSSHGIDHHRRVWNYSKELLTFIPSGNIIISSRLPSELIIACYLHDIGMSIDPGVKHGIQSRELCKRFLILNNLKVSEFLDILEAIENHDNKDYTGAGSMNDLLTILSVSDDLDAFGYTGIFRYAEIYLTRRILPENIGNLVRENVKKRFDNIVNIFGDNSEFTDRHRKRFNILAYFFSKYNEELPSYHFGAENPHGYCGVIEIIHFMMKNNLLLKDIFLEPEKYSEDPVIQWFFLELEREISAV
jgi:hypothetical protein